jgi:hypothetical protein
VLTLTAAFFGILVKQWLREYLRWNSPLDTPRENILVRQLRVEAWEAWNVGATISLVPALLELSIVLFFGGMVVLLWTLDDAVAIVVTAFVLLFLVLAVVFMILLVVSRRCPYKSPTAWAVARSLEITVLAAIRVKEALQALLGSAKSVSTHFVRTKSSRSQSWRERDLEELGRTDLRDGLHWHDVPEDTIEAAKIELAKEKLHLTDNDGHFTENPLIVSRLFPKQAAYALLTDIDETTLLLRALLWVQRATQDTQVSMYIDQCMDSIHPEASVRLRHEIGGATVRQLTTVSNWCILAALQDDRLANPRSALHSAISAVPGGTASITTLRLATGVCASRALQPPHGPYFQYRFSRATHKVGSSYVWPHVPEMTIVFRMLALHFQRAIADAEATLARDAD